ncbi:MAG: hypothetical protein ACR2PK_17725 [Acidimicrobiales bacterium]
MIPRPTVPQLLQQCRRELMQNVVPQISDETTLVALEQVQMILDNCAYRAEHEITDLLTESAEMETMAIEAVEAHTDSMPRTRAALATLHRERSDSLLTSKVGENYQLAAETLSCAIEELMDLDDVARIDSAVAYLAGPRLDREAAGLTNWGFPGRG